MTRQKTFGLLIGVLLGLGAPAGALVFKSLALGRADLHWMAQELSSEGYFYVYMGLCTPLVFALFGAYMGSLSDICHLEKKSLEDKMKMLEMQSMTDDVTGLYNHRHLREEIEKEIERAKRHSRHLSALMVDVDGFKQVNDLYGHLTGDNVLREVAAVIDACIRKIDILGRYGGDEFTVILPEANTEQARVIAERILIAVRSHRFHTGRDYISLSVSIGVFFFEDVKNLDVTAFIERIDQAMFGAKEQGKDRVFVSE